MSEMPRERPQGVRPPPETAQDVTPYQLTLGSMIFPIWGHFIFNLAAAASLALVGAPTLAAAWAFGLCGTDLILQGLFRRWIATAAGLESNRGLSRLSWLVLGKTLVWFAPPTAFVIASHSLAGLGYLAMIAVSMTALGVSLGWTSRRIFSVMVIPPVLALTVACVAVAGPSAAAGVVLASLMLFGTLSLIAVGTHKAVSGWAQANARTVEAMDDMSAALERSEAAERRLRVATEIADLHVFELDYRRHTLVSMGAEQDFFEQPLTYDFVAKNPFGDVAAEFVPAAKAAWADYEAGKGPYRVEYRVNRNDGREVWAFTTCELTRDEAGRPVSMVGAMHNITERKRAELELTAALDRAEAGSRAKSDFLATMSHEIRTPLNGVLGMAQAMAHDKLSAAQRDRLEVIRRSGETLLSLLNSVLDLSKIEAGKFELDNGEVDIEAVARAALDAFGGEAAAKGLGLVLSVAPEARGVYAGDPTRLSQVLCNLVSNAVKFTPEGAVTLSVSRDDGLLTIAVMDTGIGISPEHRDALFEKFVQADSSVTRRFGGTGLGLAICRQLVDLMGGAIAVADREAGGTVFTVSLPLARLGEVGAPTSAAVAPKRQAEAPPSTLRVLAAEDNEVNRLVLQTLLQQVGIDPTIVGDGMEALAAWHANDWDIILMDVQMPVLDGVSATQAIRAEEAETGRARTPIIALTANVMAHQVEAYRAAGVDDVVGKPLEISRLLEVIAANLVEPDEGVVEDTPDRYFG
jgi:signal transduction histidine kinase/ActR/RegA family two-component response regulator